MEGAAEEVASMLEVALPAGQRNGVVHLEVARGALLSGPKVPPTSKAPLFPLTESSSNSCLRCQNGE